MQAAARCAGTGRGRGGFRVGSRVRVRGRSTRPEPAPLPSCDDRQRQSCIRVQLQWARHGGERRRRRQGRGGEDDVAAGVRVLHGPAHRSREGLSLSYFKFAVDFALTEMDGESIWGWVRRRRRYRRSPRRAPRAWRGGTASLPTSSAPMPRLLLQFSTSVAVCAAWCDRNAAVQSSELNF